jgi:hypothetical protein
MDRSFLSQPEVIAASRPFVCVRLATYEDEAEGTFLKSLMHTRSGELENSVFCIFAPDGKERLVRAGRSMKSVYADAHAMADGLHKVMEKYQPKAALAALPLVADVRLAIDVAASDNQPLVVILAKTNEQRQRVENAVAELAWDKEFIGRFVYVSANDPKSLAAVSGVQADSVLLAVQPDKFGQSGKVLAQTTDADVEKLRDTLRAGAKAFARESKLFSAHVGEGHRAGVFWETKTPVTDPQEAAARERGRRK